MRMPRMSGAVTGNFGKAKVKARPGTLDISNETLKKNNLRIPKESDAIARYMEAYNTTHDPKLKSWLFEQIRDYYNKQVNNQRYVYTFEVSYLYGGDEQFRSIEITAPNQISAEKILTNTYTCRAYHVTDVKLAQ